MEEFCRGYLFDDAIRREMTELVGDRVRDLRLQIPK